MSLERSPRRRASVDRRVPGERRKGIPGGEERRTIVRRMDVVPVEANGRSGGDRREMSRRPDIERRLVRRRGMEGRRSTEYWDRRGTFRA